MFRFYSKSTETKSRVAVVGVHSDGVLSIAVSRCSSKDNFMKKKGRKIAEGRLANGLKADTKKNTLYAQIPMEACDVKNFLQIAHQTAKTVDESKVVTPLCIGCEETA